MFVADPSEGETARSGDETVRDRERIVGIARPIFEEALGIAARSGMSVQKSRRAAAAAAARYVTLRTGEEVSFEWIERNMR